MKHLLTLFFVIALCGLAVFPQKKLKAPPVPLIYKAPVKADLKEFTAEDKSYSITFPGVPKTFKRDLDKAIAVITSVNRQGSNSMVTVFEFGHNVEDFREKAFELFRTSLQSSGKIKIVAERDVKFDGLDAKEFDLSEDLTFSKIRVFVSGKRIFELRNDVTNWHILSEYNKDRVIEFETETKRFFDSFKLLYKPEKETVPIDFLGITNETTYVNKFFGFSLEFPAEWFVDDDSGIETQTKAGLELLKTNQAKLDRTIAEAAKQEVIVFAVSKEQKDGVGGGDNFLVGVMKLPDDKLTPDELLKNTKELFLQNPKFKLFEDIKNIELDGVKFSTLAFETTVENITFHQKLYLTVRKGYSINFAISYLDDDGRKSLEKIVKSVKFDLK